MPTRVDEYKPEYCRKVDEYLETCGSHNLKLPQIADFAKFIGYNRDTLYKWEKDHEDFKHALDKIRQEQEIDLVNNGLYASKEVSAAMAIFLLKANHGMIETEKKVFEGDGFLINLDTDAKDRLYEPESVSTETT